MTLTGSLITTSGTSYAPPVVDRTTERVGPWGEAVRYWLFKRQLSQAAVARAVNVTTKTMGKIAAGHDISTKHLIAIAKFLGVPIIQVLISPERLAEERLRAALDVTNAIRRAAGMEGEAEGPSHPRASFSDAQWDGAERRSGQDRRTAGTDARDPAPERRRAGKDRRAARA